MPLVAAAVCPHPPMIVPAVAGSAADELGDLRAACDAALSRLAAANPRSLLVVGTGERDRHYSHPFRGSFAPWGLPLEVWLGDPDRAAPGTPHPGAGDPDQAAASTPDRAVAGRPDPAAGTAAEPLPLSLLVGAWLLRRSFRPAGPVTYRMATVGPATDPDECARRGARLDGNQPWALLVMGDGSAARGERSPRYADPRAEAYDDAVAAALRSADPDALLGLDPVVSAELGVAGRAPWQVLAGAARAAGMPWRGDLSYYAAPYGVAYFVATWERA